MPVPGRIKAVLLSDDTLNHDQIIFIKLRSVLSKRREADGEAVVTVVAVRAIEVRSVEVQVVAIRGAT